MGLELFRAPWTFPDPSLGYALASPEPPHPRPECQDAGHHTTDYLILADYLH